MWVIEMPQVILMTAEIILLAKHLNNCRPETEYLPLEARGQPTPVIKSKGISASK
jgi:hypothetical protein